MTDDDARQADAAEPEPDTTLIDGRQDAEIDAALEYARRYREEREAARAAPTPTSTPPRPRGK